MGRPGIAASALKQPTRTAVALPTQRITIEPRSPMLIHSKSSRGRCIRSMRTEFSRNQLLACMH